MEFWHEFCEFWRILGTQYLIVFILICLRATFLGPQVSGKQFFQARDERIIAQGAAGTFVPAQCRRDLCIRLAIKEGSPIRRRMEQRFCICQ
jgi:hypothetical protein